MNPVSENHDAKTCSQCGGLLVKTSTTHMNYIDLVGVSLVGLMIFGFIGLLLLTMDFGRLSLMLIGVSGLIAFGLYHMVDFKRTTRWHCPSCDGTPHA
jgi:uncharacterized membrane protein YuzA (DUF378 family)